MNRRRLTFLDRAFIRRHRSRHGRLGGVRTIRRHGHGYVDTLVIECVCGARRIR